MKQSPTSATSYSRSGIIVLVSLSIFFIGTTTPIQAPAIPSYDDFPFDQQFDCSNYVALVFPQYESLGRNVTIEYGYNDNRSGHLWICEDGRIIDGGDPVWITENYIHSRRTFNSVEEARNFFGEEELNADLSDRRLINEMMLEWLLN
jgi:hypothetical protein